MSEMNMGDGYGTPVDVQDLYREIGLLAHGDVVLRALGAVEGAYDYDPGDDMAVWLVPKAAI